MRIEPVDAIIQKADTLLEALPYIRRFSGKTVVVKYGGHAMEDEGLKRRFAEDIVLLKYVGMKPVIVHGGGPQIGKMLDRMDIPSRFVRGMRVTDAVTMEIVEMVLGRLNKEVVTLINGQGGQAVGLSGKDGNLIIARKLRLAGDDLGAAKQVTQDLGFVGEVMEVAPRVIDVLATAGFIPVIAPIGAGIDGETYNINADLVAGKVAEALAAEKLILLTDVPGIKDRNGTLIPTVTTTRASELIAAGIISEGMIPKVECCIAALRGGAKKTHVVDGRVRHAILLEIFTKEGIGTEVVRDGSTSSSSQTAAR